MGNRLVAGLAGGLVRLLGRTARTRVVGAEAIDALRAARVPLIFLFWHRHIFHLIYHFRGSGARPLISQSSDGQLVADVAAAFGMRPVRGSSSRGGARAFLELAHAIAADPAPVLITADGPKGPAGRVKPGAIELARRSGARIVPVAWYGSRVKALEKSWDRFLLPLPFSRIVLHYGAALAVGRGDDADALCRDLADRLDQLERNARRDCQRREKSL